MMILSLAIFAAYACAGCAQQVKTFYEMTPTERATFFMSVYSQQYDDYKFWQDQPLTEEQRKIMREKKRILTDVYPMIMAHNFLVDAGLTPPVEQAEAILVLINQLVLLMIQGGQI
jgi:antibiotic biosynthesis monooxygenase (ABM) superfamily enzyme